VGPWATHHPEQHQVPEKTGDPTETPNSRNTRSSNLSTARVLCPVLPALFVKNHLPQVLNKQPFLSTDTIPRRRGSARGGSTGTASGRGTTGRIRKNTRNRQTTFRYGHHSGNETGLNGSEESLTLESETQQMDETQYGSPHEVDTPADSPSYDIQSTDSVQSEIYVLPRQTRANTESCSMAIEAISLDDMRELLRSHEEEIVNQVVLRLQSQNPAMTPNPPLGREIPPAHRRQEPPPPTTTAGVAKSRTR